MRASLKESGSAGKASSCGQEDSGYSRLLPKLYTLNPEPQNPDGFSLRGSRSPLTSSDLRLIFPLIAVAVILSVRAVSFCSLGQFSICACHPGLVFEV